MTITKSFVLVCGLAMLPGCPLLDVEVEVPDVCLTYRNLQIPGAPGGLTSAKQSFVFDDLSAAHDLTSKVDADLEFVRAEVRATSGIDSFSFIHAVHVVVASGDPDSQLPPLTIYNCDGDCAPDGNKLAIPAEAARNAVDYLKTNSLAIELAFEGELPAQDWTMDIDVCMKARAGYTFSP